MNCGGETVGAGVSKTDGVLFGLEFSDGADGAEDLFLHDLHVFTDVGEDSWLNEVTFFAVTVAADFDLGALLLASVNVANLMLVNEFPCSVPRKSSLPHNTIVL